MALAIVDIVLARYLASLAGPADGVEHSIEGAVAGAPWAFHDTQLGAFARSGSTGRIELVYMQAFEQRGGDEFDVCSGQEFRLGADSIHLRLTQKGALLERWTGPLWTESAAGAGVLFLPPISRS